jgi:glycosyltransferase involved in cell wall biosynthesis
LKGGELAIRAFAQAASKFSEMTLTIVGSGGEEGPLKRLVKALALEKAVVWQGWMPKAQITDFMGRHDAFLFTSLRDTSGNVVLEAMSVGLPVITLRHQGAAEITTDETAIRVPITSRSETLTHLSNAILALAQSPALRDKLGDAGRERIKARYLWNSQAERMHRIYGELIEQRRIASSAR